MISFIRKMIAKSKGIEYSYHKKWMAFMSLGEDMKTKEDGSTWVFPYFVDGHYVDHKLGDIVPLFKKDNEIFHYTITKIYFPGSFYDAAMWDDGKHYDFKFDHIEIGLP